MEGLEDGALKGLRVLEIAHHMAGPIATQKLGDMGAEVIKVEPPGLGEWTRSRPIGNAWVGEINSSLIALNRNKKSITLNLKSKQGLNIFYDLVKKSDIIVSNYRPTVHKRLGTDYETVKEINSRIIYCSITGYGETGHMKRDQDKISSFRHYPGSFGILGERVTLQSHLEHLSLMLQREILH